MASAWEDHWSAGPSEQAQRFAALDARGVLPLVEALGLAHELPVDHGSVENRVFSCAAAGGERRVLKLYRPGRWSLAALHEELRLLDELRAEGVPVVRALPGPSRSAVGTWEGIHFVVFEHVPTVDAPRGPWSEPELRELGRMAARVHRVSARAAATHRMDLEPRRVGLENLALLERGSMIPADLLAEYAAVARALIEASVPRFAGVPFIRVHGDFGVHNMLRGPAGLVIADFDDFTMGPAVFDLCRLHIRMVTPWGDPEHDEGARRRATRTFIEGYRELRPLPDEHLRPGPALRGLRTIWNDAWKQSRLHDAAFCRARAVIREREFWPPRIAFMRAQLQRLDQL